MLKSKLMLLVLGLALAGAPASVIVTDELTDDAAMAAKLPQRRLLVNDYCLSVALKCWAEMPFIEDPNKRMLMLWVIDEYLRALEI